MRRGAAIRRISGRYILNADDIIGGETAGKSLIRDTKMTRRRVLEIRKKNTGSVEDGNEKVQKEEDGCDQRLLRFHSLYT